MHMNTYCLSLSEFDLLQLIPFLCPDGFQKVHYHSLPLLAVQECIGIFYAIKLHSLIT